jgi:hypothetical protein
VLLFTKFFNPVNEYELCLSQAIFSLPRSRFLFRYAYCKSGFNLFLETLSAKHSVCLGGLPDGLKQLRIDVRPKQFAVNSLPLSGFRPKPEIIFVWLNQRVPLP